MKLLNLTLWDMRVQAKSGFYFLYAFLTILYIIILLVLPVTWKENFAVIMIFSDPAAMGLFFMGALILLEKSQRVPCALAAAPIKETEYVLAKVISLGTISLVVALILGLTADVPFLPLVLLGTALSFILFTLSGVILATKIKSLNQFILWTVPIEILGIVPALLHLFGVSPTFMQYYPANVCIDMISGKVPQIPGILGLLLLTIVLYYVSVRCVKKMWMSAGGVDL